MVAWSPTKGDPMRRRLLLPAAVMLVGAATAGCGDDQPAVCTSIDELKSSVEGFAELDPSGPYAVASVQDQLARVESDYNNVKKDASDEYDDQVAAIDTELASLKTSVTTAADAPTASNLAAVRQGMSAVVAGIKDLSSDVKSTC